MDIREHDLVSADDKIAHVVDRSVTEKGEGQWVPPEEWLERFKQEYSGRHGGDSETLPAGSDPDLVAAAIFTRNEDDSVDVLIKYIEGHQTDYTFDQALMRHIELLVKGNKAADMEQGEWSYTLCKTAGLIDNWSPYAEVRAVTLPYDNPDEPCESFRAYFLGFFWVCVCTAVNTCEPASSRTLSSIANPTKSLRHVSQASPYPTRWCN
jgi:hypothetical protein